MSPELIANILTAISMITSEASKEGFAVNFSMSDQIVKSDQNPFSKTKDRQVEIDIRLMKQL